MHANGKRKDERPETISVPRIDARTLLVSGLEVILVHKETEYRLRLTSNDKLILTK
jgi:hemin uptake protein HemP